MKKKKEVWVEVCDYCGKPKARTCPVCGQDICDKCSAPILTGYVRGYSYAPYPKTRVVCLCHFDERIKNLLPKWYKEDGDP